MLLHDSDNNNFVDADKGSFSHAVLARMASHSRWSTSWSCWNRAGLQPVPAPPMPLMLTQAKELTTATVCVLWSIMASVFVLLSQLLFRIVHQSSPKWWVIYRLTCNRGFLAASLAVSAKSEHHNEYFTISHNGCCVLLFASRAKAEQPIRMSQ